MTFNYIWISNNQGILFWKKKICVFHAIFEHRLSVYSWVKIEPGSYMVNGPYASVSIRLWHPSPVLLPGKSHGQRSLVGCSPWGREESDTTGRLHFHFSLSCTGEGNGNPLQCSCLENPRDGGAWWAAIYGVTQSRTWLKQLSSSSSICLGKMSSLCLNMTILALIRIAIYRKRWETIVAQTMWQHSEWKRVELITQEIFPTHWA